MITVRDLLERTGPSLSSDLVSLLVKQEHINREAARKRVSRSAGLIKKLKGLRLPNREDFLYLEDQFGGLEFTVNLTEALRKSGSSLWRALSGIIARGGAVKQQYFPIASGLPIHFTRGQLLHSYAEESLLRFRIIEIKQFPEGEFVGLRGLTQPSNRRKAVLIVESVILSSLKTWLTKVGFSSYKATQIRDNIIPSFGPFNWDLVGPSYLTGLVDWKRGKIRNGFIVGDIILDRNITSEDILPFLAKCGVIINQKRHRPFIPLFIADSFEESALKTLRKKGVLLARPETFFGTEAAANLTRLVGTIENAAAAVTKSPEEVFKLLESVGKIEGSSLNLRGIALDFFIAHLYSLKGYRIDFRKPIFSRTYGPTDIDVKADNSEEVVCVESKGLMPGNLLNSDEIKTWLSEKLPKIKDWLKDADTLPNKKRFEFSVSTDYTEEAKKFIRELKGKHIHQPITFSNGSDIISRLQALKQSSLIRVFKDIFVNNPISP